ncbi:hypothetical protein HBH70_048500 [Parastagonospora nodorum]|nr:hypothetical protein HBH54_055690 [Parastagonospora nodorum]KAH3949737.1 hypothetical protein HBH53_083380 [Parastagonospora nodorum]KAH3985219.1 hypothetical protein HBH52_054500 [Parastagonospora nodorum]KAH4006353.1 hypothetical protein HBI10_026690 [Parastagonospora nodorum]KAH4023086.1 hypothetical protein HBI13_094310 [Parastagonospora nodorum]
MFSARPGPKDKSRFPPTHVMHQLWEAFVENFDPLTKIVHVPSLRPVVERAIGDVTNIPRNLEALISAILGAGILSLKDRDCQQRFGETRRSMLSKYSSATEAALSRAKFMATTSLVVLQALVIHLYSVRDVYEPRTVWTLTGVAVRIAQGLSLDRDGTTLGLSPFDTEIRRRIWWQLKSHDFRTAELCGLAKFRDIETSPESTKWPSNIGGNDLHPKMSSLEITSTGLTDAAFVAFKFEMTKFAAGRISIFRKRGIDSSQWNLDIPGNDKEEIQTSAETLREALEMKYLRYCDPSQPLHLVLLLVGRYGMNIVTFLTHHPRRWAKMEHVTPTERVLVWDGSIKLLDQYSMMQSNPIIQQFAWHARKLHLCRVELFVQTAMYFQIIAITYFIQWHAFIHVLDTLRAEPLRSDALKAWQLVESIYESTPELGSDLKKPIHVAIGNLCLKAYRARETALLSNKMYSAPTPTFIRNLRHRRENAIEKRKAREAKMQRSSEDNFVSRLEFGHSDATQSLHQSTSTNTPKHNQADTATEVDPLRLFDGFDDNLANELYMDLDFDLPSDYSMQDYAHEPIDWSQWDAWLANSNVMRSSTP